MTESNYQSGMSFYCENAIADVDSYDEDDPEVNRIEITLVDSEDKLFLYPKKKVKQKREINGMESQSTEEVNYSMTELPEWIQNMIKQTPDIPENKVLRIQSTAQVINYDDGNTVYRIYQNMINSDKFNASIVQKADTSSNSEKEKDNSEEVKEEEEESVDMEEILQLNVSEVKDQIKNLDNPDYEEILELEKEGSNRKTVKDFLKSQGGIGDNEENDVVFSEDKVIRPEEKDETTDYVIVETESEVPKFMGTDLNRYGAFEKGDVVELPEDNAELLVNREVATEVKR